MNLKVKLWIENENKSLIFGDGKNLILQYLDSTGSIKQTAKKLSMTEENVLKHLQILEDNNTNEMVLKIQGLKKDSKASYVLTPEARMVLQTYQIYQHDIKKFAQKRYKEIFKDFKVT